MTATPNTAALQTLLERVEAGDEDGVIQSVRALASSVRDAGGYFPAHDVLKAYDGSLDAAKALHEAVLPGWDFWIWRINQGDYCVDVGNGDEPEVCARSAAYPARAWLIAVLRALIADTEGR